MKQLKLFLSTLIILITLPLFAQAASMNHFEYEFVKSYQNTKVGAEIYSHHKDVVETPGVRQVTLLHVDISTGICKVSHSFGTFFVHWTRIIFPEK